MRLFDALPQEDRDQLWSYLNNYSDGDALSREHLDYFLRFWEDNKEPFFRAFGEKLILKKEIKLKKSTEDLAEEMWQMIYQGDKLVLRFVSLYKEKVRHISDTLGDYDMQCRLKMFVDNLDMLVNNIYSGPAFSIPAEFCKSGRPLMINANCKAVKMLGKICNEIGAEFPVRLCPECNRYYTEGEEDCANCGPEFKLIDTTGYEMFRQAHSQVLNQKQIKGNVCLSIHPLDYITMSDNDCGWTSCMSWMEEYGDYRLGTIEMMNSPCVVVAYVEASEPMWVCGRNWNNKRWRQLYIATREVILGNRQYPYESDDLQGVVIRWLRELMQKLPDYGPYPEETVQLRNDAWNTIREKEIRFQFYTSYMYNDVYDYRLAYVADQKIEDGETYSCHFSGPAVCTGCGDIIEYDTVDSNRVQCRACDGGWKCEICGDWHSHWDEPYYIDDMAICSYCYEQDTVQCECCGDTHTDGYINHIYIQFVNAEHDDLKNGFNYNYYVPLCDWCMKHPEEYEPLYGKMYDITDHWGNARKAFDIRNFSEDAVHNGNLSADAARLLEALRKCVSEDEAVDLIEKNAY